LDAANPGFWIGEFGRDPGIAIQSTASRPTWADCSCINHTRRRKRIDIEEIRVQTIVSMPVVLDIGLYGHNDMLN